MYDIFVKFNHKLATMYTEGVKQNKVYFIATRMKRNEFIYKKYLLSHPPENNAAVCLIFNKSYINMFVGTWTLC